MKVLVIIPAFNEAGTIQKTIDEVRSSGDFITPIVIDDGSLDDTAKKAQRIGCKVIRLPFNLGIGGAVQTGFRYAYENDFDFAVQVDGDGQHNPQYISELIQAMVDQGADICVGSRFLGDEEGFKSSVARRVGIRFLDCLIFCLTRNRITDPTSGFRAFNKKAIKAFAYHYPQDFPEPEAIIIARRFKLKAIEIPVVMRKRESGNSSIRFLKTWYYMIKVTFAILVHMMHRKREVIL